MFTRLVCSSSVSQCNPQLAWYDVLCGSRNHLRSCENASSRLISRGLDEDDSPLKAGARRVACCDGRLWATFCCRAHLCRVRQVLPSVDTGILSTEWIKGKKAMVATTLHFFLLFGYSNTVHLDVYCLYILNWLFFFLPWLEYYRIILTQRMDSYLIFLRRNLLFFQCFSVNFNRCVVIPFFAVFTLNSIWWSFPECCCDAPIVWLCFSF